MTNFERTAIKGKYELQQEVVEIINNLNIRDLKKVKKFLNQQNFKKPYERNE